MKRIARLLVLAVLVGLVAPPAVAQDPFHPPVLADDDKKPKPKPKPPKKSAVQKALEAVAAEFKAADSAALVKRVPSKAKVKLKIGKTDKLFVPTQAKGVLKAWFEKRTMISATLKKKGVSGTTGSFTLKFRKLGKSEIQTRTLTIGLTKTKNKTDSFVLRKITVT